MAQSSHRKMIQKNRVFLVESVDLTNTAILDQLVQDEVMSVEQLMAIKTTCTSNLQTVSALLDHLHTRTSEDWSVFLKCLTDNQHGHVVDALKAAVIGNQSELAAVQLQHKMADVILQLYNKIPLWTLHSDLCMEPMEHLYVDLVLVKEKQYILEKEENLQGYKDIFRKSRQRSTIYLSGEPGVGKSTLTKHICVEWAKNHDGTVKARTETGDSFDNYQFLLPLFLRHITEGQSICELFAVEYQLRPWEAEELYHYINTTEEPILIIADGLDEYSESTSDEITKLLHRQIWPHITLLITSRLSPDSFSAEANLRLDTVVVLRGFSDAGIKEYLLNFFNKDKEKRDSLFSQIQKSEELVHLSHSPAMLLMIATLGKEQQQLPSTITGFYEEFVAYVFARMEKKLKKVTDRAKSTKEILKRYNTHIMALGSLATGNLKTHKLELIFEREDVVKHISSEDLKIGFLVEKLTSSRKIFYMFIHKTLQEYFLAFFLVYSGKSTQKELLVRFFNSRLAFTESAMIRRFVVGLGGLEIQEQLNRLTEGSEEEVAELHTELQLEYLAEHQDTTLTLPREVRLHISDRYPASHYVKYLKQDASNVRKMRLVANGRHHRLLQHLYAPELTCLDIAWTSQRAPSVDNRYVTWTLDKTLARFPLAQLKVQRCNSRLGLLYFETVILPTLFELSEEVTAITDTRRLQELELDGFCLNREEIKNLIEWLPGTQLIKLKMSCCFLTTRDVPAVIDAAPETLTNLNVSGNCQEGDIASLVRAMVLQLPLDRLKTLKLQKLNMSNCHLGSCDVLAVIDATPETLTDLNVSGNCQLVDLASLVTAKVLKSPLNNLKTLKLQKLNMSNCHLASRDVLAVIDASPETLTDLNMSGNRHEADFPYNLMTMMRKSPLHRLKTLKLQKLNMSNCYFMSRDVLAVIDAAPETLIDLDVSGNCWDGSDELLRLSERTKQLNKLKKLNLQRLHMSNCHLKPRVVLAVVDAAPETLTDLDVSRNCSWWMRGDDLECVTEKTQLIKLKTFNLKQNYISKDVVRTIKQRLVKTCPHMKLVIDEQASSWW